MTPAGWAKDAASDCALEGEEHYEGSDYFPCLKCIANAIAGAVAQASERDMRIAREFRVRTAAWHREQHEETATAIADEIKRAAGL